MPPVKHSCSLTVTKNLSVNDAEKLCEYFAARLQPIRVEYNGRKGTLRLEWSSNQSVATFKTLAKCLEKVRPITEDSEDIDAIAYAFHPKHYDTDPVIDRPVCPPDHPTHVLFVLPCGHILVVPGAFGDHISSDVMRVSHQGVGVDVPSNGIHRVSCSKWTVVATEEYIQPELRHAFGDANGNNHRAREKPEVRTHISIKPRIRKK